MTVNSLATVRLDHAQLAYLSACETSLSASPELQEEAIHLTSAFQLAGYPHVIGTLWEVLDRTSSRIATDFYRNLQIAPRTFDTTRSAEDSAPCRPQLPRFQETGPRPVHVAAYLHAGA